MGKVRFSLVMDEELKKSLSEYAYYTRRSQGQVIIDALKYDMEQHKFDIKSNKFKK